MDATPEEHWLPVVGYEGLYEVSSTGRVKSLSRYTECVGRWGPMTQHTPEKLSGYTTTELGAVTSSTI